MKHLILLFLFCILFFSLLANDIDRAVIRISNPVKSEIEPLFAENWDILAYKPGSFLDIVGTNLSLEKLRHRGFDASIYQTESEILENLRGSRLAGYRDYEDLLEELQLYEIIYPNICKLYDIGDSWGKIYSEQGNSNYDNYNHEIWALKLSDNPELEEDEPAIYYFGEHHAREPISLEVCMYVLDHLISSYGTNTELTDNINNSEIWFVPLVNPNGHKIVTDEDDLWWRKNIRDNNDNGVIDNSSGDLFPDGVDPNRNYGWQWGTSGTYHDNNEITYCGPEPFSEPEIQAIKNLMEAQNFVAGISYHSYGELVLYPFGYNNNTHAPDKLAMSALAENMAESISSLNSGHYTPEAAFDLYSCSGTTDDYSYGKHGTFSYTIELATQFIPSASDIDEICEANLEAALMCLDRVNSATLTGIITDASTGLPLEAEIFVYGIDDSGVYREPIINDSQFGRYYRMLLPSNDPYTVMVKQFGYEPQTFNVDIYDDQQTILDVSLEESQAIEVTGQVLDLSNSNPIVNAQINIEPTPLDPIYTNESGSFDLGNFPIGEYTVKIVTRDFEYFEELIEITENTTNLLFQLESINAESFEYALSENWQTGGSNDWFITDQTAWHGYQSIKSGDIVGGQLSRLDFNFDFSETTDISYMVKVSCEDDYNDNFDYLYFAIDNEEIERWDGEVDWDEVTYTIPAGTEQLSWIYFKDNYVDGGDDSAWIDFISLPTLTSSEEENLPIIQYKINSVYPNPFNPETTISYSIGEQSFVKLDIYNIRGQLVRQLVNEEQTPGDYQIRWDGLNNNLKSVASGIYVGKLSRENYTSNIKMILMK